jgi:hypothetical protein
VLSGLERSTDPLSLDPDVEPVVAAVLFNHDSTRSAYSGPGLRLGGASLLCAFGQTIRKDQA